MKKDAAHGQHAILKKLAAAVPPEQSALPPPPVDSKVTVTLADRGMSAKIQLSRPTGGGRPPSRELIYAALAENGVAFGISESKILSLVHRPIYNLYIEVAHGQPPVPGIDGRLEYHVSRETSLKPKVREDGTVDYRDLGIIQQVEPDQILVERIPPTPGTEGYDVQGNPIAPRPGRDVVLPAGKNTYVSDDGLYLLADRAGHVDFIGGKVVVQETYTVSGDVGSATGNINFNGSVSIRGTVLAGFTVKATGNVIIRGGCEAATIEAGGNVTIGEGINGGHVIVAGDLKSKYLQNSRVEAGGSIYSDAVVHCELRCGDALVVSGPRGALRGGNCSAANRIECAKIGSRNTYMPTRIEVGLDPILQSRINNAPKEFETAAQNIARLEHMINCFSQLEAAGRLDAERLQILKNMRYTLDIERQKHQALQQELEVIAEKAKTLGFGTIVAKTGIAPGVRVVIGPFQAVIDDYTPNVKITRGDDGIVFSPAV